MQRELRRIDSVAIWISLEPEESDMVTYVVLTNFTDQGIRTAKDTIKRTEAFKDMAKKFGVTVREFFWTQGQ